VRVVIVGCGAVTRLFHLGAAKAAGLEVVALVDANLERARHMAAAHNIGIVATIIDDVRVEFDAAIVATPSFLHAPMSIALLERGVHVLVKKPMAIDLPSAVALLETAERTGSQLHVGQMHRFFDHNRIVHDLLANRSLGSITDFSMRLGMVEAWTTATSYPTDRRQAGGGVLIDLGSHLLDLVTWWFGAAKLLSYRDDARGGVEAECEIEVQVGGDIRGTISISRLRPIRSGVRIAGTAQYLESDIGPGHVRLFPIAGSAYDRASQPQVLGPKNPEYRDAFIRQLEAFRASVQGTSAPVVPGRDVLPTLELILQCYESRSPLLAPWEIDHDAPGVGAQ
jgi:predicted dehydrogenase